MEKTYRTNMWDGDYFDKATWYLDISGNTYEHRAELRKDRFKWDSERKVWWKWVLRKDVPLDVQKQHESDYIAKLHARGVTYPACRPKCIIDGCNLARTSNCERCSNCHHEEMTKGGLPCTGWMSNKCKYGPQLTIKGSRCCKDCYKEAVAWAKTNPFANDNS